jgi:serine/threonine-protein kinase
MATCPQCRRRYADHVHNCEHDGDALLPDLAFAAEDANLHTGELVGEYRIEGELGKGGFGTVYKAVQPLIGKYVAIKILNREFCSNPRVVSRFIAEARAVNQIRHRNIVDIFGFGTLPDGRHYFVMELLEGITLRNYIKREHRLTPSEVIAILRPIARALDAAHAAGIAHRDLKPDNVFLVDEDGILFPKIIDFGIAKLFDSKEGLGHTSSGAPIGTPAYMSPEQCRAQDVDHRTDIYSFGILAHEMLTGETPFSANNMIGMFFHHTQTPPPRVSQLVPDVTDAFDAPVLHMLAKDPAQRPQSLAEAIDELILATERAGYVVPSSGIRTNARSFVSSSPPAAGLNTDDVATRRAFTATKLALPGNHRSTIFFAGFAVLSLAVLGVAWLRSARNSDVTKVAEAATAAASEHLPASIASAPLKAAEPREPKPEPSAPVANALVEVRVQSTPKLVHIYNGTQLLGSSAETLRLPRSDTRMKLTLSAEGYRSTNIEIVPSRDAIVSVVLNKTPPRAQRQSSPRSELENPF